MNTLLRPIDINAHPVARNRYRKPTPAIADFFDLVQRCVQLSIPGAIVYARMRFDKSSDIVTLLPTHLLAFLPRLTKLY